MGLENPLHIAILLMVIMLLFGAKRLPEMGRGLGDGMRSFKDAISGNAQTMQLGTEAAKPSEAPAPSAAAVGEPRPE
jgi:sec-independent protein translocase protein TatA